MKKYVEVDREPVVGDMVKIVECTTVPLTNGVPNYKVGDILTIIEDDDGFGDYRYAEGYADYNTERILNREEFVVVESTEFTKSDLKPCMVVRLRDDSELYIVTESKEGFVLTSLYGHMSLNNYDEDMFCVSGYNSDREYDIIEVYSLRDTNYHANEISTKYRDLLYKRTELSARDIKIKELQSKMDALKLEMEELR